MNETVDPSTETAMSEPGVARPGEAAAVEAIARELAAMIDGGPSHPSPVDREYAAMMFAAAYPIIAAAVRAEERERIAREARAVRGMRAALEFVARLAREPTDAR